MLNAIHSVWKGLTFENGKFSTKRTAYSICVVVCSYIVLTIPVTWDVLVVYAVLCTSPTTLREFWQSRTGNQFTSTSQEKTITTPSTRTATKTTTETGPSPKTPEIEE